MTKNIQQKNACTALPRVKFLSNPRRMHSKGEDEEKEEQGLPRAPICCSTTFPSPSPNPPPTHAGRLLGCLGLRYQDTPPFHSTCKEAKFSDF
jgi:hypothetical protein